MIDKYCHCGKQSSGRCTGCAARLCRTHLLEYPIAISLMLDQLTVPGERPDLCEPCVWKAMENRAEEVAASMKTQGFSTPELVGARVAASKLWHGQFSYGSDPALPFGQLITLTAAGGVLPDWATTDATASMALVYSRLASPATMTTVPWEEVGPDIEESVGFFRHSIRRTRNVLRSGSMVGWSVDLDHQEYVQNRILITNNARVLPLPVSHSVSGGITFSPHSKSLDEAIARYEGSTAISGESDVSKSIGTAILSLPWP